MRSIAVTVCVVASVAGWSTRPFGAPAAPAATASSPCTTRGPAPAALRHSPASMSSVAAALQQRAEGLRRLGEAAPEAPAEGRADVYIRGAAPSDALELATLCTDCFFGRHSLLQGPIVFAQRAQIWGKILRQVSRRIAIEGGRECRLLVACDVATGRLAGCVDVAVHLFDTEQGRFELTMDAMPEGSGGRYAWRPYVASLGVREEDRRRGVGRKLMAEAERQGRRWGHKELMLEVAATNADALGFYLQRGYSVLREDVSGTGAMMVEDMGFYWNLYSVEKYVMRKRLPRQFS